MPICQRRKSLASRSNRLRRQALLWGAVSLIGLNLSPAQAAGPPPREASEPQARAMRPVGTPDPAAAALDLLRRSSTAAVEVRAHGGFMASVSAAVPVADPRGEAVDNALEFLTTFRDLYGLSDPEKELYPHRVSRDNDGEHVFFRRRYGDLPAFNGSFGVHLHRGSIVATHGHLPPASGGFPGLRIDAGKAELTALAGDYGSGLTILGRSALGVYHALNAEGTRDAVLSWRISVSGKDSGDGQLGVWLVYVHAIDNEIVVALPQHESYIDKDFDIMTGNNGTTTTCWTFGGTDDWFNASGPLSAYSPSADNPPDGMNAYLFSHMIYDLFHNWFDWHSYDNSDAEIESIVHVGNNWGDAKANGFCGMMQYGDGLATSDVFAHEYSHLVDYNAAGLEYQYLSGALDESFADTFGAMVDTWQPWTMGEDIPMGFGGTFRSLEDPPLFGHPDHVSAAISGDGMGLRTNPNGPDNGFVHTNSGIPNKVAFLVTQGGFHNGYSITGMGKHQARLLYHAVLTQWVTDTSDFEDARSMMINQATLWANANQHFFKASDVCQIRNAWASVGIQVAKADVDCDGLPDHVDPDDDGDNIADLYDNCLGLSNPLQKDLDSDGVGDACDPDKDGDLIDNLPDNCELIYNPLQLDQDSDGLGDVCDDSDGDGLVDASDNCVNVANPDQLDTDSDSLGNACDPDDDNDGLLDGDDNCPEVAGLDQTDTDGDGVGDLCDNCLTTPNPSQQDCNGNGIGTACDAPTDKLICTLHTLPVAINDWIHPLDPVTLPHVIDDFTQVPEGFRLEVTVTLEDASLPLHIVDQTGRVVARGKATAAGQPIQMSFAPDFNYHYVQPDGESRLPWETRYFVEIPPGSAGEPLAIEVLVETSTSP